MAYHIVNARIVNDGTVTTGDLSVARGRILGVNVPAPPGAEVIDAAGAYLLPGMIDDQVHFREPGFEHKATIATESRAAIAGGVTSYLEMPNCDPQTVTASALEDKHARAAARSMANYGFYLGATNDNLEAIKAVDRRLACGIKIFMGSSTGDLLVHQQKHLENIFANTAGIIATHAEDEDRLNARWPEFEHRSDIAAHAEWRDDATALIATKRASALAKDHDHRLHVLHLTSAVEADWLAANKGDLITTEVCPQHLTFDQTDVEGIGTRLQMNPPIRYAHDRDTLWNRLKDGTIDCIATDHAPHTLANKALGFPTAHSGMPGVETSLPCMLTHAANGMCSIADVARWMCEGPARVYGMVGKGRLAAGYDADLVLVDMENRRTIQDSDTWTRVGWTPYAGREMTGWPIHTIVDGRVVHSRERGGSLRGTAIATPGSAGRALKFS